jgi:hypothetical protein
MDRYSILTLIKRLFGRPGKGGRDIYSSVEDGDPKMETPKQLTDLEG